MKSNWDALLDDQAELDSIEVLVKNEIASAQMLREAYAAQAIELIKSRAKIKKFAEVLTNLPCYLACQAPTYECRHDNLCPACKARLGAA